MEMDLLESSLRAHLKAVAPRVPEDFSSETDFRLVGLDSLDLMEFVARIEREFQLMVPDEDLPDFISLDATARYLRARLSA